MIRLTTPLTIEKIKKLHAGDEILLSGTIYTGRDAAHKRLMVLIEKGEKLPLPLEDQVIFYVGPTPVSYTHLDVYKRQQQYLFKRQKIKL